MARASTSSHPAAIAGDLPPISPPDTARYIRDMLDSLRALALSHDQRVLARLLEAASSEAERAALEAVASGL